MNSQGNGREAKAAALRQNILIPYEQSQSMKKSGRPGHICDWKWDTGLRSSASKPSNSDVEDALSMTLLMIFSLKMLEAASQATYLRVDEGFLNRPNQKHICLMVLRLQ
eukprot:scaffold10660_cov35-Prasinocladus_malaysianus.AAC.1